MITNVEAPGADWRAFPIYQAFPHLERVGAAYTGKGTAADNKYFSFHRPPVTDVETQRIFLLNMQHLARVENFDQRRLTLPNGPWPHSGRAIKAEEHVWTTDPMTLALVPVDSNNQPIQYDGIATRSSSFVLAAQGADCPSVFFFDPKSGVIGIAHAGWRPLIRGVIRNTVNAMVDLGANTENIFAFVSPGAGDRCTAFQWDKNMEPEILSVFVEGGRHDLLGDRTIRHNMTEKDRQELSVALGRSVPLGSSFKLSTLAVKELELSGLLAPNISRSHDSCIIDRYTQSGADEQSTMFRYHSYRRERPQHGLSIAILFLRDEDVS